MGQQPIEDRPASSAADWATDVLDRVAAAANGPTDPRDECIAAIGILGAWVDAMDQRRGTV